MPDSFHQATNWLDDDSARSHSGRNERSLLQGAYIQHLAVDGLVHIAGDLGVDAFE